MSAKHTTAHRAQDDDRRERNNTMPSKRTKTSHQPQLTDLTPDARLALENELRENEHRGLNIEAKPGPDGKMRYIHVPPKISWASKLHELDLLAKKNKRPSLWPHVPIFFCGTITIDAETHSDFVLVRWEDGLLRLPQQPALEGETKQETAERATLAQTGIKEIFPLPDNPEGSSYGRLGCIRWIDGVGNYCESYFYATEAASQPEMNKLERTLYLDCWYQDDDGIAKIESNVAAMVANHEGPEPPLGFWVDAKLAQKVLHHPRERLLLGAMLGYCKQFRDMESRGMTWAVNLAMAGC